MASPADTAYVPRRAPRSRMLMLRGLRHHVRAWGSEEGDPLVLLHGGLDSSATFQFVVDALPEAWRILAPDLRGHGDTQRAPHGYWFHDYLADLDALLDALGVTTPIRLAGHSLGGNIAGVYAGLRPRRIARLVALDAFGMRDRAAAEAPDHLARWLDGWTRNYAPRVYESVEDMASRLQKANPNLPRDRALYLATHGGREMPGHGFTWRFDPAHRRPFATLHRIDEWVACWQRITAPILWVQSGTIFPPSLADGAKSFDWRFSQLPPGAKKIQIPATSHNLHHEKPEEVARVLAEFVGEPQ